MRELYQSLDKVRWHKRFEKDVSLYRLLRYKMATKETLTAYESFLTYEKILRAHDYSLLFNELLSDDEILSVKGVMASLENLKIESNEFTKDNIYFDTNLNIIKCQILLKDFSIAENILELFNVNFSNYKINEHLQDWSKYTFRLIVEIFLFSCEYIDDFKGTHISDVPKIVNFSIILLFELLKFQESVITKHIKTSNDVYQELLQLMYLGLKLYIEFGYRCGLDPFDVRFSISSLCKNMHTLDYNDQIFSIPVYKILIYTCLWGWFDFSENTRSNKMLFDIASSDAQKNPAIINQGVFVNILIYMLNVMSLAGSNFSRELASNGMYIESCKHSIEICFDIFCIILMKCNQYSAISSLNLKYLFMFFENSNQYSLLACSFFSGGHYVHSAQTCKRILEFDPSNTCARMLLVNLNVNIFNSFDEGLKICESFAQTDPNNPFYYLSKSICYIEKSLISLSFSESVEFLNLAKNSILTAISLDDNDHELYFYAALIFALLDDLDNALLYSFQASKRSLFDSRPYHMMFLVFLNKGLFDEALKVLTDMEHEFPADFGIILNKIDFDFNFYGAESALSTARQALDRWFNIFSGTFFSQDKKSGIQINFAATLTPLMDIFKTSSGDIFETPKSNISNGSKVTATELKLNISYPHDRQDALLLLNSIILKMAEIYLEMKNYELCIKYINDIHTLGYMFPEVFLIKAKYFKSQQNREKCRECLETANFLNPNHFGVLHDLSIFYLEEYSQGQGPQKQKRSLYISLAEESARKLVSVAPKNFISWQCLGQILNELDNNEESLYCLNRALELENFSNKIPFKNIFRRLRANDRNVETIT